jgi:hypothetical protein
VQCLLGEDGASHRHRHDRRLCFTTASIVQLPGTSGQLHRQRAHVTTARGARWRGWDSEQALSDLVGVTDAGSRIDCQCRLPPPFTPRRRTRLRMRGHSVTAAGVGRCRRRTISRSGAGFGEGVLSLMSSGGGGSWLGTGSFGPARGTGGWRARWLQPDNTLAWGRSRRRPPPPSGGRGGCTAATSASRATATGMAPSRDGAGKSCFC